MPIPFVGAIISAASTWLGKRQDTKAAEATAKTAWETAVGRSMENGWKDEYVTVVITFPLWQIFIGQLLYAFTDNAAILDANDRALEQIGFLMETPYGELMMIVVLAAVGIKGLKLLK
jgi:Na+/H+-translocating membrane pyrophosphatase